MFCKQLNKVTSHQFTHTVPSRTFHHYSTSTLIPSIINHCRLNSYKSNHHTTLFTVLRDINMTDAIRTATTLVTDTLHLTSEHEKHVGTVDKFSVNQPVEVEIDQVKAVVIKTNTGIYAVGNKCTHYGAPLNKAVVENDRIKCPWHGACFHLKTGDIEEAPACDPLPSYKVRVAGNDVYVTAEQSQSNIDSKRKIVTAVQDSKRPQVGNKDDHIVIVGGGSGGQGCLESLREIGYIGQLTVLSAENTLPYDRTKLSKTPDVDKSKITIRNDTFYKEQNITMKLNTHVKAIDTTAQTVTTDNNDTIKYTKLVIATGGSASKLGVPGENNKHIHILRIPADADHIIDSIQSKPQCKVVIIGSGFIGMEISAFLQKQKQEKKYDIESVTNINMVERPFEAVLGQQIGDEIMSWHQSQGVKFITNAKTTQFEAKDGAVSGVTVEHKDKRTETVPADVVIIGAGIKLNTDFIKNNTAFKLEKNGAIIVDNKFQAAANVYAIGDIAKFPYDKFSAKQCRVEHWSVAMQHGRMVAAYALSQNHAHRDSNDYIPFFWSMQYGNSIRYVGHSEKYDNVLIHGNLSEHKLVAYYVNGDTVEAVFTWQKDPFASAASELLRINKMPTATQLKQQNDFDLIAHLKSVAAKN